MHEPQFVYQKYWMCVCEIASMCSLILQIIAFIFRAFDASDFKSWGKITLTNKNLLHLHITHIIVDTNFLWTKRKLDRKCELFENVHSSNREWETIVILCDFPPGHTLYAVCCALIGLKNQTHICISRLVRYNMLLWSKYFTSHKVRDRISFSGLPAFSNRQTGILRLKV